MDRIERASRASAPSGFTLVEALIVLACASILLTASVPNLNRLQQEWTLWGNAHMVESALRWGRSHAISANTSMMLVIDEDGRRFYWVDGYSGDRYEGTVRYLPGRVRIVGAPRLPLRFYQRGNAAPAGTFTLQGEGGVYRVIVSPAGRIRLQRN